MSDDSCGLFCLRCDEKGPEEIGEQSAPLVKRNVVSKKMPSKPDTQYSDKKSGKQPERMVYSNSGDAYSNARDDEDAMEMQAWAWKEVEGAGPGSAASARQSSASGPTASYARDATSNGPSLQTTGVPGSNAIDWAANKGRGK